MTKTKTATPESRKFAAAIEASGLSKASIAEVIDVTPSNISHWASALRPIPADKAPQLAKLLRVDPEEISAAYRQVQLAMGNLKPKRQHGDLDNDSLQETVQQLEEDMHVLNLVLGALASVMVVHRPAEAAEAAAAIRRRLPSKYRAVPIVHELIELLEKPGRRN